MKMFIPKIGTRLTLSKPWKFNLEDEHRNNTFWEKTHGNANRPVFYYGYTGEYDIQRIAWEKSKA